MSEEKNINEMSVDKIVVSVYNQIAEWHNDDGTQAGLKHLSFDLIQEITGAVCDHFEIPFGGEIKIDDEYKKEAVKEKYDKD